MLKSFLVGLSALAATTGAHAGPAKILHQSTGAVIVRLGADGNHVVWQEVGDKKSDHTLYSYDAGTGVKAEINAPKRPFGPAVSGGYLLYGAGRLHELIEVYLTPLSTGKSVVLHARCPDRRARPRGCATASCALWERSDDIDGNGLIYLYSWCSPAQGRVQGARPGPC